MYCKIDVDDVFYAGDTRRFRILACDCAVLPVAPAESDFGCVCGDCRQKCRRCSGFGYAKPPTRRFHEILTRVRSQIRQRVRIRGVPPGFVRLTHDEIDVVMRKFRAEDHGHWVRDYVAPGPPVRVFDVLVVRDSRKELVA